jgi:hypothetical protein
VETEAKDIKVEPQKFDVFISAKSEDYCYAEKIYDFLKNQGINVFFSEGCLHKIGNTDFRYEIDRVIEQVNHMVVVTSSPENLRSKWVQREWGIFENEKLAGRKNGNIVTVVVKNIPEEKMPLALRSSEVLQFSDSKFEEKLLSYVGRCVPVDRIARIPRKNRWVYGTIVVSLCVIAGFLILLYLRFPISKSVVSDNIIPASDTKHVSVISETSKQDNVPILPQPNLASPVTTTHGIRKNPQKEGIAVFPFKVIGNDPELGPDTGNILCDAFTLEMDPNRYEACEWSVVKEWIKEKGLWGSVEIDNIDSAAKLGVIMDVRYVTLGSIAHLGNQFYLSARVVDCKNGEICKRGKVVFSPFSQWPYKMPDLAYSLSFCSKAQSNIAQIKETDSAQNNSLINTVNSASSFAVSIKTMEHKQTYLEGEFISFEVFSEKDCYITMITVDNAGDMTLLLPNPWHKQAFLRACQKIIIPSSEMKFKLPIQPPHGETLVKVIATEQPLQLSGVDLASYNATTFVPLTSDVGAVGIGDKASEIQNKSSQIVKRISELLKPNQWATAELVIVTAPSVTPAYHGH